MRSFVRLCRKPLCRGIFGRWIVWVFLICFKNFVWSNGRKTPRHRGAKIFGMEDLRPPVRGLSAMKTLYWDSSLIQISSGQWEYCILRFHPLLINEKSFFLSVWVWWISLEIPYLLCMSCILRGTILIGKFWLFYCLAGSLTNNILSDSTNGHRRFPASNIVVVIRLSMVSCWLCLSTCTLCLSFESWTQVSLKPWVLGIIISHLIIPYVIFHLTQNESDSGFCGWCSFGIC